MTMFFLSFFALAAGADDETPAPAETTTATIKGMDQTRLKKRQTDAPSLAPMRIKNQRVGM